MSDLKHIEELIEITNCLFVSFKYLSEDGNLRQIDVPAKLISSHKDYVNKELDLNLDNCQAFVDPFRAMPTVSVFARKNSDQFKIEDKAEFNNLKISLSFWITNNEMERNDFLPMQADPVDVYANLRSEIMSIAMDLKINVLSHHYGRSYGESVINFSAENLSFTARKIIVLKFLISNAAASYNFSSSFVTFDQKNNLRILLGNSENRQMNRELLVRNNKELYELLSIFSIKQ